MAAIEPTMPQVDAIPDIEAVFRQARASARVTEPAGTGRRHVVVVTPGRLLMQRPCPPPGSMAPAQVQAMVKLLPPATPRQIAAIGYTELKALQSNLGAAIPFFGLLLGLAYIGHAVWVFEGHASALAAGCREADLLIVDGGMEPFLPPDWVATARSAMRGRAIYSHDRATFGLRLVSSPS